MDKRAGTNPGAVLERLPFCGRTFAEYQQIFDLDLAAWKGRTVLDCPAGASSFVAESGRLGVRAVACDPQYGRDLRELADLARTDIERVIENLRVKAQGYDWTFYSSLSAVKQYRLAALERFSRDYPAGLIQGRYVKAVLPFLPFGDRAFDLVLSSYFLFLTDQFDYQFHLSAVLELYRVCRSEVRIYPIRDYEGYSYPYWDRLLDDISQREIQLEILPIAFEFQRGSNEVLRLIRE